MAKRDCQLNTRSRNDIALSNRSPCEMLKGMENTIHNLYTQMLVTLLVTIENKVLVRHFAN